MGGVYVRHTVRSGAGAAVGVVAELVDVHAALGRGIVAGDVVGDGRWGGLGGLLKVDGSADLGVTAEDCDCDCKKWCLASDSRGGVGKREGGLIGWSWTSSWIDGEVWRDGREVDQI